MAITREQIWAAADEIDAAGQNPTLAAVRKAVGGGSFTTIQDAMTEWKAKKAAKGKKGVSGNPAKRSGNPAAASAPEQFVPQTEAEMQQAMADFQLPPELQKMFNQQQNKGPFG